MKLHQIGPTAYVDPAHVIAVRYQDGPDAAPEVLLSDGVWETALDYSHDHYARRGIAPVPSPGARTAQLVDDLNAAAGHPTSHPERGTTR